MLSQCAPLLITCKDRQLLVKAMGQTGQTNRFVGQADHQGALGRGHHQEIGIQENHCESPRCQGIRNFSFNSTGSVVGSSHTNARQT
jgi:hypothetical protein